MWVALRVARAKSNTEDLWMMEMHFFFLFLASSNGWKNHFTVVKGHWKKQNKKKQSSPMSFMNWRYCLCRLMFLDRLISKCGPVNNLSNIILVLRHGDSLCRTGRLCTFFRKWIASEAAEMRQRVRRDASHKVSYFPGRLRGGRVGGGLQGAEATEMGRRRQRQPTGSTVTWSNWPLFLLVSLH